MLTAIETPSPREAHGSRWAWRRALPGDGPVLDVLLEATFVGEDLVTEVAALLLAVEQQPEEEAVDPAHEAWQEGAAGGRAEGLGSSNYCASAVG